MMPRRSILLVLILTIVSLLTTIHASPILERGVDNNWDSPTATECQQQSDYYNEDDNYYCPTTARSRHSTTYEPQYSVSGM